MILIRFDNKEYLKELQNGKLFLRTCLYYQQYDKSDTARSDSFDGSLPLSKKYLDFSNFGINGISNSRITDPDSFIKCFYMCFNSEYKQINPLTWELSLSDNTINEFKKFGVESALLIFNVYDFINQIKKKCNENKESFLFSPTEYLSNAEQKEMEETLFKKGKLQSDVSFFKDNTYNGQKELRVCVKHKVFEKFLKPFKNTNDGNVIYHVSDEFKEQVYTIDIGQIKNSVIVDTNELFQKKMRIIQVDADEYLYAFGEW